MSKKLKIRFTKFKNALAMQILEQEGLPKEKGDGFIKIIDSPALDFVMGVWLRGYHSSSTLSIETIYLNSNTARDEYLRKAVDAITDELFTGEGELKVGEMCEVSDCKDFWVKRRLLAILPERYEVRFITENDSGSWSSLFYARPIVKRQNNCRGVRTTHHHTWEER